MKPFPGAPVVENMLAYLKIITCSRGYIAKWLLFSFYLAKWKRIFLWSLLGQAGWVLGGKTPSMGRLLRLGNWEIWTLKLVHNQLPAIHWGSCSEAPETSASGKPICIPWIHLSIQFQGGSLSCDLNSLMGLRKVAVFQLVQVIFYLWG